VKAWYVKTTLWTQGIFFSPTLEEAKTASDQIWLHTTGKSFDELDRLDKQTFSWRLFLTCHLSELDPWAERFANGEDLAEENGEVRQKDLVICPHCNKIIGAFGIACASLGSPTEPTDD